NKGYREALLEDKGFLEGLNVIHGKVTCKEVAESFDLEYVEPTQAIAMFN
ncbi:alanine dehydrogenase, partial [Vibrio parahaemolyticus]|nr:alanine dehydrogenase [Vibrio parahaemolyticus]